MSGVFNSLSPNDYTITPFPAYYSYNYLYESGSTTNPSDIELIYAKQYPLQGLTANPDPEWEGTTKWRYFVERKLITSLGPGDGVTKPFPFPPFSNLYAAKMSGSVSDYNQEILVKAKNTYHISGWIWASGSIYGGGSPGFKVFLINSTNSNVVNEIEFRTSAVLSDWVKVEGSFVIPMSVDRIRIATLLGNYYPPTSTPPFNKQFDEIQTCTNTQTQNGCPGFAWYTNLKIEQKYGSDFYRKPNKTYEYFDSIKHIFYSNDSLAAYPRKFNSYIPSDSTYVISVTQDLYGSKLEPNTVSININTSSSFDDGYGNLITSQSGVGYVVGSVFYDKGIILLKPTSSVGITEGIYPNGVHIKGRTQLSINFSSSLIPNENVIRIKLQPTDYLYTNNPSITAPFTTGSLEKNILDGQTGLQALSSGSLLPYITTIGFYNRNNELMLVGKLSNPIQRTADVDQTFIVKFDTY